MGNTNTAGMSVSGTKATIRKIADALTDPDKEKGTDGLRLYDLPARFEEAERKVFDDMWRAAAGTYGDIDHTHYDDPDASGNRRHTPYYLNRIWLTYKEAVAVMEAKPPRTRDLGDYLGTHSNTQVRTNLPPRDQPWGGGGADSQHTVITGAFCATSLEVVNLGGIRRFTGHGGMINALNGNNIHTVIGQLDFFSCGVYPNGSDYNHKMLCGKSLVTVDIKNLNTNLALLSPVLSFESVRKAISQRYSTGSITLTLHPDVYAKLTDESDAEAMAILDLAAQKNVNIATTE